MTTWAKDNGGILQYAAASEFKGIPNWQTHESACRAKGYYPLAGEAEPREGYAARPATWHKVEQSTYRTEPRQKQVEGGVVMEKTDIELDKSYIQIDTWDYEPLPEPEPESKPDTTERDNAEKTIVAAIKSMAIKYNALDDIANMQDITIPNLKALADAKGVPEEEFGALITMLTPYKWQLEAVTGLVWAEAWEGLKSRFAQWMQEINTKE